MKRLKIFLPLFVFLACEKEEINLPEVYVFRGFETGTVRVFTKEGEITSDLLSGKFIANNDYFVEQNSFELPDFSQDLEIIFETKGKAVFQGADTVMTANATRVANKIYFESNDTLYSDNSLINMRDPRFQFSPITQTDVVEAGFGGFPPVHNFIYGYRSCVYAIDYGQEIKVPFINILDKKCPPPDGIIVCNASGVANINNAFNENYLNVIKNSTFTWVDTLIVQQNYVVFRKE
ncbi:MAG TPA: hypothetical protein VD884_21355 [Ohtaekwangia sp.]|nr:hypothetical protein [Ohtaekwangia sp.]